MSLINSTEREKQILRDIAIKLNSSGKKTITNTKGDSSSYYKNISCSQNEYIKVYSFDSIVELKSELTQFWQNEDYMREFIPVVLASTFKNRPETLYGEQKSSLNKHVVGEDEEMLPTFIYTM